ncbi:hypothetical protein [Methanosarcina sp. UBA5]|uniref:hypothetical protein n=1 Tax=Methanosarcina sp. UBA5 TaxID=1915593 RepID=UPI0025E8A418|nr:hypothetical protein [Methanosarcina sp. UBA5]
MAGNSFKAVRDLIPEILKLSGRECIIREISDSSFLPELENKLEEELKEYLESKELEELADLLEVIYRAELRGSSKTKLEAIRQRKKQENCWFEKNLLLLNLLEEGSHPELSPIGSSKSRRVVFKLAHFTPLKPCLRFFPANQLYAH